MLSTLAQTLDYTTTSEVTTSPAAGIFGGTFLVVWLVLALVMIVSMWKLFEKAGQAGWKSLVPVYSFWVLCELVGKPGWWSLVVFIAWIPFLGAIAALVVSVIVYIELAKSFGKEASYAALLILLPFIGFPMLAFGDSKYVGPGGKTGATA